MAHDTTVKEGQLDLSADWHSYCPEKEGKQAPIFFAQAVRPWPIRSVQNAIKPMKSCLPSFM